MDKELAKRLLRLRTVSQELNEYADYRERLLMKELLTAPLEEVPGLQKSYQEIRRLRTLSDEIAKAGD